MLETKHPKLTRSADEAFAEIGVDVWTGPLAEALKEPQIVRLRAVSKSLHAIMSDDDMWLDRATLLSIQHPTLADLAKGAAETVYAWYVRCRLAAADGSVLALAHKRGEQSYLKMYGTVDGSAFTPFAELRFPMPRGFIAELIALKQSACCKDPPMDALLSFPAAPHSADHAFRGISKKIKEVTARANSSDLRTLPDDPITGKWELRGEARVPTCVERMLDVRTCLTNF